ncbi:MAG: hypothetical protein M1457_03475 [bacterium]|nr:hypothetical protein [bacterium]
MKARVGLNEGWRLRHFPHGEGARAGLPTADPAGGWWEAAVPGDIHIECQREGMIPDPFLGANLDHCRWMEEKDWWYRLDFAAPARRPDQRVFLLLEGLDTFATVYLNGREAGRHRNMFTPLRLDVTDQLAAGSNRLAVCLAAPRYASGYQPAPGLAGLPPLERLVMRKAQASFGWDIAPRLATCGIWRPVSLLVVDVLEIGDVALRTLSADESAGEVEMTVEIVNHGTAPAAADLKLSLAGQTRRAAADCAAGTTTTLTERFMIDRPRLWWPHNHGTPHLYDYAAELRPAAALSAGGAALDERTGRFGIRTIRLVQEPQGEGKTSFRFTVNGKPIFLKGMNWTPADAIYARINRPRYEQLLAAAADAGLNALRVWGGGIYEGDAFYELCDERGILLWHDFMFACGCYPQDEAFLAEARAEAEWAVRRLRSRACLMAWCGDNENDWLSTRYGVPGYRANPLSKRVLAEAVARLASGVPYVPSSPFSPREDDQNSPREGDVHLWAHGHSYAADFYLGCHPRMVTEIGHLAMPDMAVIERFVPEAERWPIWNDAWRSHSADPNRLAGNGRLATMPASIRARGWQEPATLEELIRMTQQLQAEATAAWIRHFGNDPECWGLFLWNLADCWPQVSDAYIAYPFHPKPAFAAVKEEYAKIAR